MTKEEIDRFVKYFNNNYNPNSYELGSNRNKNIQRPDNSRISANSVALLNNQYDSEYLYIGLGNKVSNNNVGKSTKILLTHLFTFKKSEIKYEEKWFYDYVVKTNEAFWYFWNNSTNFQKWTINLTLKTWGSKNTFDLSIDFYDKNSDPK